MTANRKGKEMMAYGATDTSIKEHEAYRGMRLSDSCNAGYTFT